VQPLTGLRHTSIAQERIRGQGLDAGHEVIDHRQLPRPTLVGGQGPQSLSQMLPDMVGQDQRQVDILDLGALCNQPGHISCQPTCQDLVDQRLIESHVRAGRHGAILPDSAP
jgi:hypothetical protein